MNTATTTTPKARRRIAAVAAGLAVAIGALAPSAHAVYYVPREQPPDCTSAYLNLGYEPICEETEFDREP